MKLSTGVVPPQYRPGCSGFVCPPHLKDEKFRTEYFELLSTVREDKDIERVFKTTSGLAKSLLSKKAPFLNKLIEMAESEDL